MRYTLRIVLAILLAAPCLVAVTTVAANAETIRENYVPPSGGNPNNGRAEICGLTADEAASLKAKIKNQVPDRNDENTIIIPDPLAPGAWCVNVYDLTTGGLDTIRSIVRTLRSPVIRPGYQVAGPQDCVGKYYIDVPMDSSRATTLRLTFQGPFYSWSRFFSIPAGTGLYTLYTEQQFGGDNLETYGQTATIVETGLFGQATTVHR